MFCVFPLSLLGPRRKLSLAIAELKEEMAPRGNESDKHNQSSESSQLNKSRQSSRPAKPTRPPLFKQPSTELQNAYHQVKCLATISYVYIELCIYSSLVFLHQLLSTLTIQAVEKVEMLEAQLMQEHALRNATDSYLLELQQAKQKAASCLVDLRDGQEDIVAHCKAIR